MSRFLQATDIVCGINCRQKSQPAIWIVCMPTMFSHLEAENPKLICQREINNMLGLEYVRMGIYAVCDNGTKIYQYLCKAHTVFGLRPSFLIAE